MASQARQETIIGYIRKGTFWGQVSCDGKEYDPICLEGEEKFPWSEQVLSMVIANEQLNQQKDSCRILLVSDVPLPEWSQNIPKFQGFVQEFAWEQVVACARQAGIKARKWAVDGEDVAPWRRNILPVSADTNGSEVGYIYALPKLTVPENAPQIAVVNSQAKVKKQIKKELPLSPADIESRGGGSSYYEAMVKLANKPRN